MQKRWKILTAEESLVNSLQESLKINRTLCRILAQRGVDDFEKAKTYFRPQLSDLHDPWLMKDMHKAVDRITTAFEKGERILVFGDYDVDGTTSVASMFRFLTNIYSEVDFYIPHRYREGYGVSKAGIDYAKETAASLIHPRHCQRSHG